MLYTQQYPWVATGVVFHRALNYLQLHRPALNQPRCIGIKYCSPQLLFFCLETSIMCRPNWGGNQVKLSGAVMERDRDGVGFGNTGVEEIEVIMMEEQLTTNKMS